MRILVSAGEASGDLYASRVVETLKTRHPEALFFGCAGPRMQAAGVRPDVDARSLSVVGIVEVLAHIPRIYGEFRKLIRSARAERPDLAILTDSPDFHLRLARKLRGMGIPVVYLIAPQAWAWRQGRANAMRRDLRHLLCIFPFEEAFFRERGVPTTYIGHPLARMVKPSLTRNDFCARFGVNPDERILVILPGSRRGEVARHMPYLIAAAQRIRARAQVRILLALPGGFSVETSNFAQPVRSASIQVIEGYTWDCLSHAEVALAASGTVTIEAALLGVPMATFYRVNALTWLLGRWMVKSPFLSMVNLVAGHKIVPELIQKEMTPDSLASEALRLLDDESARRKMRGELAEVAAKLKTAHDPMIRAAEVIEGIVMEGKIHAGEHAAG